MAALRAARVSLAHAGSCKPGRDLACTLAWCAASARRAGKGAGHGYKFCSEVGDIIADLAAGDGTTRHDIGFLRCAAQRSWGEWRGPEEGRTALASRFQVGVG